jgi:ATP-dependent Clp protease ATP-binding subunit ClpC
LNRIDEIIVFHALDRAQIREIVGLQLGRVRRTAQAQGVTLEFDGSLVDHLAEVGFQPEFGARELRRRIRGLVETQLAGALLRGDIAGGDTVVFGYDTAAKKVRWEKRESAPAKESPAAEASDEKKAGTAGAASRPTEANGKPKPKAAAAAAPAPTRFATGKP